jgi:hypothetical protein
LKIIQGENIIIEEKTGKKSKIKNYILILIDLCNKNEE